MMQWLTSSLWGCSLGSCPRANQVADKKDLCAGWTMTESFYEIKISRIFDIYYTGTFGTLSYNYDGGFCENS